MVRRTCVYSAEMTHCYHLLPEKSMIPTGRFASMAYPCPVLSHSCLSNSNLPPYFKEYNCHIKKKGSVVGVQMAGIWVDEKFCFSFCLSETKFATCSSSFPQQFSFY